MDIKLDNTNYIQEIKPEYIKESDFISKIKDNIDYNEELIRELSNNFLSKIINYKRISTLKIINTNLRLLITNTKRV